ncbi:hypothetical protein ACOME3_007594 [Neoechinorhynchus agilis]
MKRQTSETISTESEVKEAKVLQIDDKLPTAPYYRQSFMHRDTVTHVLVVRRADFVFTGSVDGHVKLWKVNGYHQRNERDIRDPVEFVKDFHAHLGPISQMCQSRSKTLVASLSAEDRSFKVFDVHTFDMICMQKLLFVPQSMEFVDAETTNGVLLLSDAASERIAVYDSSDFSLVGTLPNMPHKHPVNHIRSHPYLNVFVSTDTMGMIELSYGGRESDADGHQPGTAVQSPFVTFRSKCTTDMFVLCMQKTRALDLQISEDGMKLVILAENRCIYVFDIETFKLIRSFDQRRDSEASKRWWIVDQKKMNDMDIGRKMAIEEDIDKDAIKIGDERDISIGQGENIRPLCFDIWPESGQPARFASVEAAAAASLTGGSFRTTAIIFSTAYKSNRFFVLEGHIDDPSVIDLPESEDRDIMNERPYHDALSLGQEARNRLGQADAIKTGCGGVRASNAVIHTTLGDIAVLLYPEQCPKTVENFCSLAQTNYYIDGRKQRKVLKFMIQTGDPLGTGVGGQSIWGHDFEDEFHPSLKHDKPYTLSMANAGPNSNGSQFFITVVPCPWLDQKHTLFGRVISGMDVVHKINNLKVNKNDKPEEDVKIMCISLKRTV